MKQLPVRCTCGKVHQLDNIGPEDARRTVICEWCGRSYIVAEGVVPGTLFLRNTRTNACLPTVREDVSP